MASLLFRVAVLVLLLAGSLAQASETRFHQYTKRFHNPNNPAKPLAAGYFGGSGDEYLIGAAIRPDGTVLLAGNAYGPEFDPQGVRVQVLGRDTSAPDFTMPTRRDSINPPDWQHTAGAGFIVRLSSDYGSAAQVVRFPWGAGSITDAVADAEGGVYITGIIGEHFDSLVDAQSVREEGIDDAPGRIFVARLTQDLSGFDWCLSLKDNPVQPPKLEVLESGLINVSAQHARHIQASGEVVKSSPGTIYNSWVGARNPIDHSWVAGAMNHTNTGYEPWRQPFLVFREPDGTGRGVFYRVHSRLVGTPWSRLVSDSEIRGAAFDRVGNALLYGWSDGGNSVLEYAPYDMRTGVRQAAEARTGRSTGLGFSTWGAGVGSFAHIIRLDSETGEPLAKTNFIAYLAGRNAPSSVMIDTIKGAVDDSVLLAGGSAFGLIETGSTKVNTLDYTQDHYIGGTFVAILNEAMSDIRYSSALPGAGQVDLLRYSRGRQGTIEARSARVGDKTMVVFVSGAKENEHFKPVNNAQDSFGGGNLDGMYVVLEMDTLEDEMQPHESGKSALTAASVPGVGETSEDLSGTFNVTQGMNRHHSLLILRDDGHRKWPTFYMSHPEGEGSVDASGSGSFVLRGPGDSVEMGGGVMAQENRLGGHVALDSDGDLVYPELRLAVTITDRNTVRGELSYNGKTVSKEGRVSMREARPVGRGISIHGVFRFTKDELGLSESDDDGDDQVTLEFWAPGRP